MTSNISNQLREMWPLNSNFGSATATQRELIHKAATRIEELEAALRFYADEWEQDVDAEQTIHGWTGTIGEIAPTPALLDDYGRKARATLQPIS